MGGGATSKPGGRRMRREAGENFVALISPIRDRIATERGDHRTVWVRSKIELGNACQDLRPHLAESDGVGLDAAYRRFMDISGELLEPRRMKNPPPGEGVRLDYSVAKNAMLEPIKEMVRIAGTC